MSAHDYNFLSIGGEKLALAEFTGRPVLIVNTASECGYTPQYQGMQSLWERYRDRGLVVLGVPSNDFGEQEPGDEDAIKRFCDENYRVDFPMTTKQTVIGPEAHPFYRWVEDQFGEAATPRWNFHKYLVDADGELVDMWPSAVEPLSEEVIGAIEEALGKG